MPLGYRTLVTLTRAFSLRPGCDGLHMAWTVHQTQALVILPNLKNDGSVIVILSRDDLRAHHQRRQEGREPRDVGDHDQEDEQDAEPG